MTPKELKALVRIEIDELWTQFEYRKGMPDWSTRPLTDDEFDRAYVVAQSTKGQMTGDEFIKSYGMMYYWVYLKCWELSFVRQLQENIEGRIKGITEE